MTEATVETGFNPSRRLSTPREGGEKPDGKFFYAVIHTHHDRSFGDMGIEGATVYSIRYLDVAAMVSDYPHDQIRMLRKNLSPYQLVLREAGDNYTTLPAKFGQIARSEDEVVRVLKENYLPLKSEVVRLQNKKELGLTVFWTRDDLLQHLAGTDSSLKAAAINLYGGKRPLSRQEQIELGSMVRDSMTRFKRNITDKVLKALNHLVSEVRVDEPAEEKMIINASLLVQMDCCQLIREAVEKMAAQMAPHFELKLSGPWVPFSFVRRIALF